jgi:hypothetical protein
VGLLTERNFLLSGHQDKFFFARHGIARARLEHDQPYQEWYPMEAKEIFHIYYVLTLL